MKHILFISAAALFTYTANAQNTNNDTLQYVVMKVNNPILDCPHFGGLFFKFCYENGWKIVENNHSKKYIILGMKKNVGYNPKEKWMEYIDQIHFPKENIVSIEGKQTKKEVEEAVK